MQPFTPTRVPAADLSDRTVGRDAVLGGLRSKLLAAATTPGRPHTLLVGGHGMGKTHLIEVALWRAAAEPGFAERVVVVRLPEDSLTITRYEDLPVAVLRALRPEAGQPPVEVEAAADRLLGDRAAVLVVENLDRVFDDIGLTGQRALRAWLETSGRVMLLGSAPRIFPAVTQRDRPWFGGLAVFALPGLDAPEAVAVLAAGAGRGLAGFVRSERGAARIAALAALTGGAPRVWVLLAERATAADIDAVAPALLQVVEALVPQHREALAALSPNERRLVAAIAAAGAGRVGDLAAAAGVEQRTAAASLGRLSESGFVTGRKPERGDRRTTYYGLRDPMLGHHILYRSGNIERLRLTAALLRAHFGPGSAAAVAAAAGGLGATVLAAAAGDEAARLSLPAELLVAVSDG